MENGFAHTTLNEQDLIRGIKNGSEGAIRHFVAHYQQMVFSLCLGMIHQRERAEEVTQDVLVKCIRKIESYQGKSRLKTWVYRIAYNHTLNELRKFKNKPAESEWGDQYEQAESPADQKELRYWLRRYIDRLPEKQRHLIVLFYLDELSIKEIAELTGQQEGSIKVNLFRAREALRARLNEMDMELLNDLRHG